MPFDLSRALEQPGGKAIVAHPALRGSEPVSVYQPGAARKGALLTQREAKRHGDAYGGDQAIDHVMNAVDLYANTVGGAEWRLQKPDGTRLVEKKTEHDSKDVEVGPEDLYELLKRPNPYMLYDELMSLAMIDLLMVGNAYWYKYRSNSEGKPLALYRLAPPYVKIKPGQFGPDSYEYQLPGMRDPLKISREKVMHMRLPNPHDAYYGMGVIRKGGRLLDLELEVTNTMASYYANKAEPSVIIQSERRVPRDVFNKLRAQLRARIGGSSNAGELLVLESGLKAETLSRSAQEAMFKDISNLSAARIYAMFRTNPRLFGLTPEGSSTDKVSDARREFDTYVMRPFLDKLQRQMTENITKAWDLEFKIDYNYVIPQDELLKNISTVAAIPGIKVRELRRALLPLGFLDGESTGDPEIDDEILNMPMEELDENGMNGAADRPLAGEAGRPPKGENTTSFSRSRTPKRSPSTSRTPKPAGKALEDLQEALRRAEAKAAINVPDDNVNISVGRKLTGEKRPGDPSGPSRDRAVNDITTFIEAATREEATKLERALLDHVEGKAFSKKDVAKRIANSEAWVTFREGMERVLQEAGRRALSASVMDQAEQGRVAEDELDYDAIVNSVIHRKGGLNKFVQNLKRRTVAKIQNLGPEATVQEANALVQDHIKEFKAGQAGVIAVSEAVELYNEGVLSVAEATGATEVFVIEEDDAPDQPCLDARDSVWSIEYARDHRKEHPNCRRAFVALDPVS
jgi:HK97 family phage portal protein